MNEQRHSPKLIKGVNVEKGAPTVSPQGRMHEFQGRSRCQNLVSKVEDRETTEKSRMWKETASVRRKI